MQRTRIVLPDGTEIFSGTQGTAVMKCDITRWVNDGTQLTPGGVCAAMAEITLLEGAPLEIKAGDALTLYSVDALGNQEKLGIFLAQKPVRSGNLLTVTAYDRLRLLDTDISQFLRSLEGWPYSLLQLAELCCTRCGLTLVNEDIPNGSFPVEKFSAEGVTGRMVMEWVAQAAGCFCVADQEGNVTLSWYTPGALDIGPEELYSARWDHEKGQLSLKIARKQPEFSRGSVTLESEFVTAQGEKTVQLTLEETLLQTYCKSGGLRLESQSTTPVAKVVLRQTETDVGTAYPENTDGCALCITGNPLLAAKDAQHLKSVAQTLFERFGGISYTPGTLLLPGGQFRPGQRVQVTDTRGSTHTFYIMQLQRTASGDTLTCTGSPDRALVEAVENRSAKALSGKLLQLRADVDGLQVENADNQGKLARLELDLEGIRTQVSAQTAQQERITTLEQTAQGLSLSVEKLQTEGADKLKTAMGYTFDDNGLQIFRSGQQMKNLLDNTGMYVKRGNQTILQANDRGVEATDVTVGSYLVIGSHARLENYTAGRTACFWLEG